MTAIPDALDLEAEVKSLFTLKMRGFLAFCAAHWTITEKDMADIFEQKSPDWIAGYNAAITDGISGAFDHWVEDEY